MTATADNVRDELGNLSTEFLTSAIVTRALEKATIVIDRIKRDSCSTNIYDEAVISAATYYAYRAYCNKYGGEHMGVVPQEMLSQLRAYKATMDVMKSLVRGNAKLGPIIRAGRSRLYDYVEEYTE